MATKRTRSDEGATEMNQGQEAASAAQTTTDPSNAQHASEAEGYEPRKKKKKKKKYTRVSKVGQKREVAVSKGVHRLARAIDEGLGNWRKNRDRSSRKKRDGAVRDALKNSGKAISKLTKEASKIPRDITGNLPRLRGIFRS